MSHRRKSSHPVCKTKRNLDRQHESLEDDDDDVTFVSSSAGHQDSQDVAMETGDEAQQIVLPSSLFKDFEAVRSQAKMDATNLMRRLLKDYQSIASTSDKQGGSMDPDLHGNDALVTKTSIANDVSLATTRVDTDEDQYQGLDLSVGTRKITSQLFDTKSLDREIRTFDQPLDLSCGKPMGMGLPIKDEANRESPTSSQLEGPGASNEFNYVYVYPGLYPPTAVVNPLDELDTSHQDMVSPVPELISPGKIPSPDTLSRAQYLATTEALETAYGMGADGDKRFVDFTRGDGSPPSISPVAKFSPSLVNRIPSTSDIKPPTNPFHKQATQSPHGSKPSSSGKGGKSKHSKRSTEMKVISEHTSAGVYTSVMKLPWSRRTRTKKPKHKVKLEDTLIPQFLLDEHPVTLDDSDPASPKDSPRSLTPSSFEHSPPFCSTPNSSQPVMMVYPNAANTTNARGKIGKKRGRPPKLPTLTKMLHVQTPAGGKSGEHMAAVDMQADQQVASNGGLILVSPNGQMTPIAGGVPLQPVPLQAAVPTPDTPSRSNTSTNTVPQSPVIPNMAQAQLIGQIPLTQLTGGPIQFLGQFPANALPFHGQHMQALPIPVSMQDSQGQPLLMPALNAQGIPETSSKADGQPRGSAPPCSIQYAFQPMFIPNQPGVPYLQPVSLPGDIETSGSTLASEAANIGQTNVSQTKSLPESVMSASSTLAPKPQSSGIRKTTNNKSGPMYQEMILSSKSLVDVKKRKRKTAIQMLKAKSGDDNFLCTSFRIRPRLVAQAQAQKERLASRVKDEYMDESIEISDPKNLLSPQNDENHFGENNGFCDVDFSSIQIKQEIDTDDEVYEKIKEYERNLQNVVKEKQEALEKTPSFGTKRYMLKGSQKRKAKFYGSRIVNEPTDGAAKRIRLGESQSSPSLGDNADSGDMFQEMFNCKICNKIISVDEMEKHSLDHLKSTVYQCKKCGKGFGEGQIEQSGNPTCSTCNEPLVTVGALSESGGSKIACDECSETFKSLPEFYEHKTAHKNSQGDSAGFECDFCGKIYQYYHALQFHRRTHRERKVACMDKTCDLKFRSRKEMESHFDSRHPDKKEYFHCIYEGCSKKFLKNFHLQEHIRVKHYNIKAFQCPWPGCVKEFAAQRHLKIHLLIHRDEKPMKCDHCDYRCRQRSAMNWHMRKHPDVPYKYKRAVKSPSISKSESE